MSLRLPSWLLQTRDEAQDTWKPVNEAQAAATMSATAPVSGTAKHQLSRVCDFTFWTAQKTLVASHQGRTNNVAEPTATAAADDFTLVDSTKVVKQKARFVRRARPQVQQNTKPQPRGGAFQQRPMMQKGSRRDRLKAATYQNRVAAPRWNNVTNRAVMAEFGADIDPQWHAVREITMQNLASASVNAKEIVLEDVEWRGEVHQYNSKFDGFMHKAPKEISSTYSEKYTHVVPGPRDDDVLPTLLQEHEDIQIITTSQVLAALLAAPMSRYPFQLHAYKLEGKLILEKPETGSVLDLLPVNECSADDSSKNRSQAVALEAAKANVSFRQTVIDNQPVVTSFTAAEVGGDNIPGNVAHRYRTLTLPPGPVKIDSNEKRRQPIKIALRAQVDACVVNSEGGVESYVNVHALNEPLDRGSDPAWVTALEKQKSTLLLTQMKNNANKMAKWLYSAVLSGSAVIKMGLMTKRPDTKQVLLAVQNQRVNEVANQMGLLNDNAWGLLREILDITLNDTEEDGLYILTRDALSSQIKLHFNPLDDEQDKQEDE